MCVCQLPAALLNSIYQCCQTFRAAWCVVVSDVYRNFLYNPLLTVHKLFSGLSYTHTRKRRKEEKITAFYWFFHTILGSSINYVTAVMWKMQQHTNIKLLCNDVTTLPYLQASMGKLYTDSKMSRSWRMWTFFATDTKSWKKSSSDDFT